MALTSNEIDIIIANSHLNLTDPYNVVMLITELITKNKISFDELTTHLPKLNAVNPKFIFDNLKTMQPTTIPDNSNEFISLPILTVTLSTPITEWLKMAKSNQAITDLNTNQKTTNHYQINFQYDSQNNVLYIIIPYATRFQGTIYGIMGKWENQTAKNIYATLTLNALINYCKTNTIKNNTTEAEVIVNLCNLIYIMNKAKIKEPELNNHTLADNEIQETLIKHLYENENLYYDYDDSKNTEFNLTTVINILDTVLNQAPLKKQNRDKFMNIITTNCQKNNIDFNTIKPFVISLWKNAKLAEKTTKLTKAEQQTFLKNHPDLNSMQSDDNQPVTITNIYKVTTPQSIDAEKYQYHKKNLYHGTKNQSILSIIANGLISDQQTLKKLNEKTPLNIWKSTGQGLGPGIYLSDSYQKSLNYTTPISNSKSYSYMFIVDCYYNHPAKIEGQYKLDWPKNCDFKQAYRVGTHNHNEFVATNNAVLQPKYLLEITLSE